MYHYILKQLSRLVPRGFTLLLPNKDSILLFPISVFTFIFQNPKSSAINAGPVVCETNLIRLQLSSSNLNV